MDPHAPKPGLSPLQKALVALKELKRRVDAQHEPVAIVGIGCRFPGGAHGPDAYWQRLCEGFEATAEIPADRFDTASLYDPDPGAPGRLHVRHGAFLDDLDRFDADFFGIAPREAARLDPQQRLLLEVVWEALEHAGQPPDALADSPTGVFISGAPSQYLDRFCRSLERFDAYALTGNIPCTLSGRISYVLGLRGPNLQLDTGCSASLVAVHLACHSLRTGECTLALAGGVNVILSSDMMVGLSKTGTLAPDGRCKTFDAAADGFGRGEGCGVLVLRRLSDAQARGDRILGVVRGSGVNHDGHSGGLTVPSGAAQQQVLRRALDDARLSPAEVGMIEAHGTGTALGDPIEVGAIAAVYGRSSGRRTPCVLGAVKSNMGHLEAAAGIAGLIKATLCVERGEIPPNRHLVRPNPALPLADEPLELARERRPWPGDGPRRAGVSSFGLGGTNAHVIVEQPPAPPPPRATAAERPIHVVTLGARHPDALRAQALRFADHLRTHPELSPADVGFSANRGRTPMRYRLAVTGPTLAALQQALAAHADDPRHSPAIHGEADPSARPTIAFLFTGQGSQHAGMGAQLDRTQPAFREAIDRCAAVLDPRLPAPLRRIMQGEAGDLSQTGLAQPALFALEYGLVSLWRAWGIEPDAVVGHSVGELVAACVAGVLTLEDALVLVAERARLMQALPPGGVMLAVQADPERVEAVRREHGDAVSIAAINGPARVVLSGEASAVAALARRLSAEGVSVKELQVSHAFHSAAMEPALAPLREAAAALPHAPPRLPWITGLHGRAVERIDADYWPAQLRAPVRFADAVAALDDRGCRVLVEIGPHPTLLGMAAEIEAEHPRVHVPSLRRGQPDSSVIVPAAARLFVAGAPVDWDAFDAPFPRRLVTLPSYPFRRPRHWVEAEPAPEASEPDADAPGSTDAEALLDLLRDRLPPDQLAVVGESLATLNRQRRERLDQARLDDWLYTLRWSAAERSSGASTPAPGRWVLLADEGGLAPVLARALEARGQRCQLARPHDDLDALLAAESDRDAGPLRGVVHLGALDAPAPEALDPAALTGALTLGCGGALRAIQALARAGIDPGARLWLVTRGAAATGDEPSLAVAQAPLWGLAGVVAAEHPELWGAILDLDPDEPPATAAARIADELLGDRDEDRVAWRRGERRVPCLVHTTLPPAPSVPLHPEATYLVTGGTGALGLAVTQWLAEHGARHVALLSRHPPDDTLTPDLDALRARGLTLQILGADVADPSSLARALAKIPAAHPLRGVIHAAGIVDDGMLLTLDWPRFERVLAAKAHGAWNLHRATAHLDLFVCFSSAASLVGTLGQGNYAAGNAMLDALAHHRRRLGLPALSIQWGPWAVGMLARVDEATRRRRLGHGWRTLSVEQGQRALGRALGAAPPVVGVLPIDWTARASEGAPIPPLLRTLMPRTARAPDPAEPEATRDSLRTTLSAVPPSERSERLHRHVGLELSRVLGLPPGTPLDPRRRFAELGMDSLMAVELKNRLQDELELRLSPTTIFNHPSVDALSDHLLTLLAPPPPPPPPQPPTSAPESTAAPEPDPEGELSEDDLVALISRKYESHR